MVNDGDEKLFSREFFALACLLLDGVEKVKRPWLPDGIDPFLHPPSPFLALEQQKVLDTLTVNER